MIWGPPDDDAMEHRLARLWRSPFGRLALALNEAELELLEHPDDPQIRLKRDNLASAVREYPQHG